jgi:hypothetical protein
VAHVDFEGPNAIHKLDEWRGPAADAFRRHLGRIGTFVSETQNQAILNGLQALGEQSIEGTGADAVVDQYHEKSVGLREVFEHELNRLTAKLRGDWQTQVENEAKLVVTHPLPSYMDVSSRDFDHTKFWTEEYSPDGPFGQQVADQKERHAQEEEAEETEINKRMEGQDR